jgi:hypothetical protein
LPDVLNGRRHPLKNVVVPGLPLGDDAAIVVNIAIVLEVLLLSSAIETSQPVQFSTIAMMAVAALASIRVVTLLSLCDDPGIPFH